MKEQLKSIIRRWSDEHAESVYTHWPVLSGYGAPELDMNGAIRSMAFSIETKAPGEKPTKRQWITIGDKRAAGVPVLAFDGCIGDVIEVKDLFDALLRRDFQAAHDISSRNLVRYSG